MQDGQREHGAQGWQNCAYATHVVLKGKLSTFSEIKPPMSGGPRSPMLGDVGDCIYYVVAGDRQRI